MPVTGITLGSGAATGRTVAVPDVVGVSRDQAATTLENLNLRADVVLVEAAGPEGEVYAQDPTSPKLVSRNATVRLFVIRNPAPDFAERFTAIDDALADAETAAADRHAELMAVLQEIGDAVVAGGGGSKSAAAAKTTP